MAGRSLKYLNAVQFSQTSRIDIATAIEESKLTTLLRVEDVDLVKRCAKANGHGAGEGVDRYLRRMRLLDENALSAALDEITGLLPSGLDAEAEMRERQSTKHGH